MGRLNPFAAKANELIQAAAKKRAADRKKLLAAKRGKAGGNKAKLARNKKFAGLQDGLKASYKEAEDLIATAKKNRLATLRSAKDKAEDELKDFRAKEEGKFQKELGDKAQNDPTASLKGATQTEIDLVQRDYAANKDKTVKYVMEKVLDVPIGLSATQIQALSMGTV